MPESSDQPRRYRIGDLLLNAGTRQVTRDGAIIKLSELSFDLLLSLARNAPDVVSSDQFMNEVWKGRVVNAETVTKRVEMVRDALGDDGQQPRYIGLARGRGYRLLVPVERESSQDPAPPRRRSLLYALVALVLAALALLVPNLIRDPAKTGPEDSAGHPSMKIDPSVAVLPFENRSERQADAFFVDGIHDDLLTRLAKLGSLKVISRISVVRLDPDLSVPEIGRRLGVTAIVEGGVQRAGDRVRINVQLIDVLTEVHLWAETYDRELIASNVFEIQTEIAQAVAVALRAELDPGAREPHEIPTQNMAALEAYFLGRQRMALRTIEGLAESVAAFEEATRIDPRFALAHVGLADSEVLLNTYRETLTDEVLDRAESRLARALALDDRLAEAYASQGLIAGQRGDLVVAEAAYQRALALNPNYATAHHWYGSDLLFAGRPEEALQQQNKAAALDPLSAIIYVNMAQTLEALGEFNEALEWARKGLEIEPEYPLIHWRIGKIYWQALGRLDDALPWLERAAGLAPSSAHYSGYLGWAWLDVGADDRAGPWIDRSMSQGSSASVHFAAGLLNWFRGSRAAAMKHFAIVLDSGRDHTIGPLPLSVALLRILYFEERRFDQARRRYEQRYPELINHGGPLVDRTNYQAAIDLALVLERTGESERADQLLDRALEVIQSMPRLGTFGYGIADAQIHALRGESERALTALKKAIDEGWRVLWWYYLNDDPNLASIRDEPAFQAMLEMVRTDMDKQLARIQQQE